MNVQDRTSEFFSAVDSVQSRGSGAMSVPLIINRIPQSSHSSHISTAGGGVGRRGMSEARTEFGQLSFQIGRDIVKASASLSMLSQLAVEGFNGSPAEIQQLTHLIKGDIGRINSRIATLDQTLRSNMSSMGNTQTKEHSNNIVTSLRSKLAALSLRFKTVLEMRSDMIRSRESRLQSMGLGSVASGTGAFNQDSDSYFARNLHAPETRYDTANSGGGVSIAMPQAFEELQLVDQNNAYLSSRADAVEGIERSIAEMASMFGQITDLLRGQEDLARRIEDNTEGIMRNVDGAQQQLLTYMNWISSDRWLMARIFFVLIFFFAVFVLFLA